MIIGSGQVAKAFEAFELSNFDDAIIFASGVSDSACVDEQNYQREKDLLMEHLEMEHAALLVYFGSTSCFDPLKRETRYILHKQEMESLVLSANSKNIVLRLPNLIGHSGNPKTLINFFATAIRNQKPITARMKDWRYLIDVDWVPMITRRMMDAEMYGAENLIANGGISVAKLIQVLEQFLEVKAVVKVDNHSNQFQVPVSESMRTVIKDAGLPEGEAFEKSLIQKYLG